MKIEQLVHHLIEICHKNNLNKIYICGNGGSGKTTLSKRIRDEALKYGNVNVISTDDFMADTNLRKNAIVKWCENDIEYTGQQFNIFYDNSRLVDSSIKYSYNEIYINKITEKTERLMNAEYKCERFIFKDSFGTQSYVEKYIKR